MAEWSKAIDSKSIVLFKGDRGFESHPLLQRYAGPYEALEPFTIHSRNYLRRGGRAVEGARLESVCRFTPTEGSNPSLSAITSPAGGEKNVHPIKTLQFVSGGGILARRFEN